MAQNEEQTVVQATRRTNGGKNDSRRERVAGRIPVTIYGGGDGAVSATAKLGDLAAIIRSKHGVSSIFKIAVDGQETEVIFHDRQIHPLTGRLIHADLKRIDRKQKMNISVPLHLVGEPVGVTEGGGLLDHVLHQVEIRCLPGNIPDAIDADVSGLDINGTLHLSDIKISEKIEFVTDAQAVVATVKFAKEEDTGVTPSTIESDSGTIEGQTDETAPAEAADNE